MTNRFLQLHAVTLGVSNSYIINYNSMIPVIKIFAELGIFDNIIMFDFIMVLDCYYIMILYHFY